jgi:hypothetical protein
VETPAPVNATQGWLSRMSSASLPIVPSVIVTVSDQSACPGLPPSRDTLVEEVL